MYKLIRMLGKCTSRDDIARRWRRHCSLGASRLEGGMVPTLGGQIGALLVLVSIMLIASMTRANATSFHAHVSQYWMMQT